MARTTDEGAVEREGVMGVGDLGKPTRKNARVAGTGKKLVGMDKNPTGKLPKTGRVKKGGRKKK